MTRSVWAAAGGIVFALVLSPGAALASGEGGSAARPASAHTKQDPQRRRPAHRHWAAPSPAGRDAVVQLAPGSGYQRAAGWGRVRVLQRRLADLALAPGPIDGRYGPLTTRAVIGFQAAQGLRVDGVAGPETLTRLHGIVAGGALTRAAGDRRGGEGWVRELQRRLARLSYHPGPVDGRYGPLTARALTRYERAQQRPAASIAARSPRPVHLHPSAPVALPPTSRHPVPAPSLSSPKATVPVSGEELGVWLLLVGLAVAGLRLGSAALRRRARALPRRRRYVSSRTLAIARRAGFRYSPHREAYVLRLIGSRFGPVLKAAASDLNKPTPRLRPSTASRVTAVHRHRRKLRLHVRS